jgi:hypothetical protein
MPIEGNLDYALARVHARQGERLEAMDWRRLEANRDLGLYLAALRATTLADWVGSFDTAHDCHTFERLLRAQWRRYVDAVASWHPVAMQAWLTWVAWLPELSLLAQLARPEPAPAWMLADPVYGPLAPGTSIERATALANTALAPLASALSSGTSAGAAWAQHWRALQPRLDGRTQSFLERLLQAVGQHEDDLQHVLDSSEPLRDELAGRVQRLLRLAAGTVIVTMCHLALIALDLERLRGGLARRCLFGSRLSEHP